MSLISFASFRHLLIKSFVGSFLLLFESSMFDAADLAQLIKLAISSSCIVLMINDFNSDGEFSIMVFFSGL